MMRWIVGSSLKFRGLVVAIAVAVMILGIAQLPNAPVDMLPEFTPPTVEIQTEALGLAAEEVEQLVTVPLEQDLLNGDRIPRRDRVGFDAGTVVSGADIRARHRPVLGSPGSVRTAYPSGRCGRVATRGEAAADVATPLFYQPGCNGEALVGSAVPDSTCRCWHAG